jgi:hypothetical protein
MVVILEAHLAVGVGREILNKHKSVIEKSREPALHKRVFKRKSQRNLKSYAFMKNFNEEDWNPNKRRGSKNGSNSNTRTWHNTISSHITLTDVKNDALKVAQNRSLEDKTIQLWKHKLIYYKNSVVFPDGEIDLRDVVKIQKRGLTKIALIMEIEEPKISKESDAKDDGKVTSETNEKWYQGQENNTVKEVRRKDHVRRAWVLDFSDKGVSKDSKEWLSGLSANWKLAQQVLAVKISPEEKVFPKSVQAKKLINITGTGDIILFKSKHPSGLIIRSWTGGDYDHIALAYRFNNDVVLLEALGGGFIGGGKSDGIKMFAWQNFLTEKWYEQYSAVAIRRLVSPNKASRRMMVRKLAQFLKTVVHDQSPKYSWHPMKVLSTRPSLPPNDPKRTYFCSELIAKAYKEAGLLRTSVPTAAYYPCYFQKKKDLKLLQGFELSPDISIDFADGGEQLQ